jgi:hypothetical protein
LDEESEAEVFNESEDEQAQVRMEKNLWHLELDSDLATLSLEVAN